RSALLIDDARGRQIDAPRIATRSAIAGVVEEVGGGVDDKLLSRGRCASSTGTALGDEVGIGAQYDVAAKRFDQDGRRVEFVAIRESEGRTDGVTARATVATRPQGR